MRLDSSLLSLINKRSLIYIYNICIEYIKMPKTKVINIIPSLLCLLTANYFNAYIYVSLWLCAQQ